MLKLPVGPSRWLLPVLGWGVLTHGARGGMTNGGMPSAASPETFTVVDLHPVRGQTFHTLINAELVRARAHRQTPFLELGGSGCGVCNAVHQRLDARPLAPLVRRAFAGTYLIRIAVEEWPDAPATLGLSPEHRIPVYVAIDTMGHVTRVLTVDYWTLRNLDTDTLSTIRTFFRHTTKESTD